MTVLAKMCLLFWVEFICLIENFIRKVYAGEVWDCGKKYDAEPGNCSLITQMFRSTGVTDPAYAGKVGSCGPSRFDA